MSGTRKCLPLATILSAQYLARCLEPGNVCHSIITRETTKRRMKETLFTRHRNTVEPMLEDNRKATLQAIHTDAVNKAVKDQINNIVLNGLPHPINDSEKPNQERTRHPRCMLMTWYLWHQERSSLVDVWVNGEQAFWTKDWRWMHECLKWWLFNAQYVKIWFTSGAHGNLSQYLV